MKFAANSAHDIRYHGGVGIESIDSGELTVTANADVDVRILCKCFPYGTILILNVEFVTTMF